MEHYLDSLVNLGKLAEEVQKKDVEIDHYIKLLVAFEKALSWGEVDDDFEIKVDCSRQMIIGDLRNMDFEVVYATLLDIRARQDEIIVKLKKEADELDNVAYKSENLTDLVYNNSAFDGDKDWEMNQVYNILFNALYNKTMEPIEPSDESQPHSNQSFVSIDNSSDDLPF